jgi:opacity protein-like surface antigen
VSNQDFNYSTPGAGLDTRSRTGFDLGGFIEWFDLPYLRMLTEAHYLQKGMIDKVKVVNGSGDVIGTVKNDHRIDYLSISALSKFTPGGKVFSPYLIIGPRVDFRLKNNSEVYDELYDKFNATFLGGDIGAGMEFSLNKLLTLLAEFRYSHDFTEAYKTELLEVRNRSYQLLIGLKLKN